MSDAERERGKLEKSGLRRRELGGRHKRLYAISVLKISTYEGGSTGGDTKKITKKAAYYGWSLVTHLGGDAQNTAQKSGL